MDRQLRQLLAQSIFQSPQTRALAVGMQRADDRHAGVGGLERIVMTNFAGEIQLAFLRQRVIEKISASAGADGSTRDGAARWTGDQQMIQAQLALDGGDERFTRRRWIE